MNEKTIATIALRDHGFVDLSAVLRAAAEGVELAAASGADLAVLPETINLLHGSLGKAPLQEYALADWRAATEILAETASRQHIALVVPLLVSENGSLANRFYLLGRDGVELGFYQKRVPAVGERIAHVEPANTAPIPWEGLKLGGGICIDVYFPEEIFRPQIEAGADFFVIPSMTPAGPFLDVSAINYGVPFVLSYANWSRILDRDGKELAAGGYRSETLRAGFHSPVQQATINFTLFADFNQDKIPDVQRHYGEKVRVRFDQPNCIFLLESRSHDLSIAEVMREFGLVSRRDYFARLDPEAAVRLSTNKNS